MGQSSSGAVKKRWGSSTSTSSPSTVRWRMYARDTMRCAGRQARWVRGTTILSRQWGFGRMMSWMPVMLSFPMMQLVSLMVSPMGRWMGCPDRLAGRMQLQSPDFPILKCGGVTLFIIGCVTTCLLKDENEKGTSLLAISMVLIPPTKEGKEDETGCYGGQTCYLWSVFFAILPPHYFLILRHCC